MSKLPQISYPTYDVQLLSQKDPIKVRPFTVREEKLMLMATSSNDLTTTVDTLKQIISNCVVGDLDVENLPMIDIELVFLNLRARSIGEVGMTYFKCKNQVESATGLSECGMVLDVEVKFLEVPVLNKDKDFKIMFTDDVGVKMKYPSFSLFKQLVGTIESEVETKIAANCLDLIFDKESVYKASDCTQDELMEFVLNLPGDKYEKVREFILNTPKTRLESDKKCAKCGFQHKLILEGIEDFFV
jgi:hypothetical protein